MPDFALVAFEPRDTGFISAVPVEHINCLGERPDLLWQGACEIYGCSIGAMRGLLADLVDLKRKRTPIPARKMWELGDAVLALVGDLEQNSMEPDGLNDHLARELGIKGKRLGTIVTFRRHLPDLELIPESLRWSQCEKQARKVAEELKSAQPVAGP